MADTLSGDMWGSSPQDIGSQISVTPIGQPDAPQNTPPPASQTPADTSDEGQQLQEGIRSNEAYLKELQRIHAVHNAQLERNEKLYEEAMSQYRESMQHPVDSEIPQPQYDSHEKVLGAINQTGTSWLSTVGVLGFALAGMLGKRHSGIGSQLFMGSFLKSYAEGRNEAMKQQRENWWKQAEYEHQVNSERIAEYRRALEDAKWNREQKMDIIKTYAAMNGDARVESAADRGDIREVQTLINQQRQALQRYNTEMHKTAKAADYLTNSGYTKDYQEWVTGKWADAHKGLPPQNQREEYEARTQYTHDQYLKEKKPDTSLDTEAKGDIQDFSGKSDEEINAAVQAMPSGTQFTVNGQTYTKK